MRELNWLAAAVFRVIGCLDVSRIDFRLDENDSYKPYVLEINPLPTFAPTLSLSETKRYLGQFRDGCAFPEELE